MNNALLQNLLAFLTGLLISVGISFSDMIVPGKVIGFLDVAGNWDPSLAFVLGGAVMVTLITFRFVLRLPKPVLGEKFMLPTRGDVDRNLVVGQVCFGVGWGLIGYCPGAAITSLSSGYAEPVIVVLAVFAGSRFFKHLHERV